MVSACPVAAPNPLGHYLPYTTPPLPYYYPRAPTSTSPVCPTAPYHAECRVMVHPEYAYSSALLWADLPNKVGPCQKKKKNKQTKNPPIAPFDPALVPVLPRVDRTVRTVSPAVCSHVRRAIICACFLLYPLTEMHEYVC